jgi:LacI family transcriptional regulator, purine nucleotide synthesis repressor
LAAYRLKPLARTSYYHQNRIKNVSEGDTLPRRQTTQVRLSDVASLANVSISTASQALNGGSVASSTRARVLEAAAALKYVPRVSAQLLRTGEVREIALRVLASPASVEYSEASFFYPLTRGALDGAHQSRLHLSIQFVRTESADAGTRLASEFRARTFGALILLNHWESTSPVAELQAQGIPLVVINDASSSAKSLVAIDEAHGISLAIRTLAQHGHQHIGYVTGPSGHLDASTRLAAFYRNCAEHGLQVLPEDVIRSDYSIASGARAFGEYLDQRDPHRRLPTAWLAADDYVAAGMLHAAAARGLRVPDDFSLIGYDDIEIAQATTPPLTSVRLPMYTVGLEAALAAAALVRKGEHGESRHIIKPTLSERASVAAPKLQPAADPGLKPAPVQ